MLALKQAFRFCAANEILVEAFACEKDQAFALTWCHIHRWAGGIVAGPLECLLQPPIPGIHCVAQNMLRSVCWESELWSIVASDNALRAVEEMTLEG
ncbi:MAG: hypothetical protein CMK74_03890 [Pseudomonadales bacterium]|nr:hypothetical protein [Pseudomonadales bacterium]